MNDLTKKQEEERLKVERRKGAIQMLNIITDEEKFNQTKYSKFIDLLNNKIK